MKPRLAVLAFAGFVAILAGCADRSLHPDPAPPSDPWAPPADGKGVAAVVEYRLDFNAGRRLGVVAAGASDEQILAETIRLLQSRLKALGYSESRVLARGSDSVTVSLPASGDNTGAMRVLFALGDLKFRIEVDPEPKREDQAASLWTGTPDEFKKYKGEEIAVWKKARDQGQPYKPTARKDMRVVKRARAGGETPDDFAVVLEPMGPDDRFGGEIVTNVAPSMDRQGMPAVSFSVKTDYQGTFGAWTGKHIKQPIAIILNDEYQQAPLIQSRLTDNVEITLGEHDAASAKARQREWLAWLGSGALRVPLVFVSSSDHPPPR